VTNKDPWYVGWDITDAERDRFRKISNASREAKRIALESPVALGVHPIYEPNLNPADLMPQEPRNGFVALSLFSGGGGLDLGFARAGFTHAASYEILPDAAKTLSTARPDWAVHGGLAGDVRHIDWSRYRGDVDVIHGGPPCQPFSSAGRQLGPDDTRDMFPEFVRAVLAIKPAAFVAENVPALLHTKFETYLRTKVSEPLGRDYTIVRFVLRAEAFGVPQLRKRVFLLGLRGLDAAEWLSPPATTHTAGHLPNGEADAPSLQDAGPSKRRCLGVREALGLPVREFDALAPTIRSTLTGPRHTTSVNSSVSAHKMWSRLEIWPNGVADTREAAQRFPASNGHYRLSVADVAIIQGFPADWPFQGGVYMKLGQIGNAVPPPLGYAVAKAVAQCLANASLTSVRSLPA